MTNLDYQATRTSILPLISSKKCSDRNVERIIQLLEQELIQTAPKDASTPSRPSSITPVYCDGDSCNSVSSNQCVGSSTSSSESACSSVSSNQCDGNINSSSDVRDDGGGRECHLTLDSKNENGDAARAKPHMMTTTLTKTTPHAARTRMMTTRKAVMLK